MSTLTVELPDELAARLAAASERKHLPPAEIVREALEKALPAPPPVAPPARFDAEAHREWLRKTWGDRVFSEEEVREMRNAQERTFGA